MGNARCEASLLGAVWLHGLSGLGLASAFQVAHHFFDINLISNPESTLLLLWVIQCPLVILLYSVYRKNAASCSYLKAVGRGLLGLVVGALLVTTVAISLGAPVGIKYMKRTIYWSLLMSLLTLAPVAAIFGSSWEDWQCIFANTRPAGSVDFMVCLPAHGAILGSWFGAWPMPLDWERPWQVHLGARLLRQLAKMPWKLGHTCP
ncbi:glycosylphosphatidylinositol anchor biosynthesis protein 11 isoform X2 [Silene latifolia]|uniref:glycosylphosphatidylinositol anchor biosynthesis protein 11 isoform X2 n=1 Tax=Silene latifolia TaxID=37657 RepID=UPI003D785EDD